MSNGLKVKKRNGSIEALDLDKMHLMVEEACKGLAGVSMMELLLPKSKRF
jgi:ribonucleoside-diphosphate reductase alpha chain